MRLGNEKPSDNIEDRRGQGGFGFPRGGDGSRRVNFPIGGRGGGLSLRTLIILIVAYFALKWIFGIDLLQAINDGVQIPGGTGTEITTPSGSTDVTGSGGDAGGTGTADVTGDEGKRFVSLVLGSTERIWGGIFTNMGKAYEQPKLVLFTGFVQSACGMAQSATGPFYCPADRMVYIDLSFYQDMKDKLGAPGDFAQAYVIAHEVGHHVQNLLGIAEKVQQQRMRVSETEANALSVKMELQADCFAGIWAKEADASAHILEPGDVEEGLTAAAAIGDDRLQKQSQGYAVPDTFTHGTSEQRVRWFQAGFAARDLGVCDTFAAAGL